MNLNDLKMDTSTSTTDQIMIWAEYFVTKFQALEDENKNLKLKILEFEKKERMSKSSENNVCVCGNRQADQTGEKVGMSGSVTSVAVSSKAHDSRRIGEIPVKEEPIDEFIPDNLHNETPSMDDDIEIDIKEEDVDYEHRKSKSDADNSIHDDDPHNADQSPDMPIKHEIDKSIQRIFRSADQVSNSEPASEEVDKQIRNDRDLNHSSASHGATHVLLAGPQLLVSNRQLLGQKEPHLMTHTGEKSHTCETGSTRLDTSHTKPHTGEKKILRNLKTPFKCSVSEKDFSTESSLTHHMRTHTGEKKSKSLHVDEGISAKRSLTVEEVNPRGGGPKKQRKNKNEPEVCTEEEMPGVGEGMDPPCVVGRNPLNIKEILELILSNLGKHDLLTSRMVSHAWNDESLKVLRKSTFTQILRERNINEYIHFTTHKGPRPRPLILPFHLNLNINFHQFMGVNSGTLSSYSDSLHQMFGPECVSELTFTSKDTVFTEENMKEMGLIGFLTLISPGLKTLDLKGFRFKNDFLQNQNQILAFPNLKKLICNTYECNTGKGGSSPTYISIIGNSPNLEDLTLNYLCDLKSWPLKFNQLKSLSLGTMEQPRFIMNDILARSGGGLVLRELNFGRIMFGSPEDKFVAYNILNSVSSTLKSLKFRGQFLFQICKFLRIISFPKLPYLEHLGLEYDYIDRDYFLPHEDINLSPETFPSLKSMEFPFGFILPPRHHNIRNEFPNFIKLILRVTKTEYFARTLETIEKLFPNPSKLSLVNTGGHRDVKYLLDRFMKLNWSKNIQEIELIGFNQDYLGQVLETFVAHPGSIILERENQSDSFKMTNITTIKLQLMEMCPDDDDRFSPHYSSSTPPNLIGFGKHFPQLRMIEISELLFHQQDKNMWTRDILEFKSKFPNVVLYVT